MTENTFGLVIEMDVLQVTHEGVVTFHDAIATEIPLTIMANDTEIATLLTSPSGLKELTFGYLFTSGFIKSADDVTGYTCDEQRWTVHVNLKNTPDPSIMRKRLYTSGCGKCAMYTTIHEISLREKLKSTVNIRHHQVFTIALRLRDGTPAFKRTGSVHSAFYVNPETGYEIVMDDVARHNAIDKVAGRALIDGIDLTKGIIARTGRTSSEIIYKIRKCGIPVVVSRGAPTHQAVHLGKELGITIIGFARENSFNVYSCPERVSP